MPPKQWAELAPRFSRQTDKASGVKPEKWVHMMSLRKYPRHTYDGRRSTGHGSQLKKLPPIRSETAVNRLEPETQHNLWGFANIKEDWINVGVGREETHLICGRITDNWFIYLADTWRVLSPHPPSNHGRFLTFIQALWHRRGSNKSNFTVEKADRDPPSHVGRLCIITSTPCGSWYLGFNVTRMMLSCPSTHSLCLTTDTLKGRHSAK